MRFSSKGIFKRFALITLVLVGCRAQPSGVSRLADRVVRGGEGTWKEIQTDHFHVRAQSVALRSRGIREAEFAFRSFYQRLDLPVSTNLYLLFVVEDPELWNTIEKQPSIREDGTAMQINREIYIYQPQGKEHSPVQVTHEVMHVLLSEQFDKKLPLWLEEGTAQFFGWDISRRYLRRTGKTLTQDIDELPAGTSMKLEDLLSREGYPTDTVTARAFYREADQLARRIYIRMGKKRFMEFMEFSIKTPITRPVLNEYLRNQ